MPTTPLWPPTRTQALALRAALLPGPAAAEAWRTWCAETDIGHRAPDAGSYRVMPLIGHNLSACAPEAPLLGRLHGLQKRTWYLNQRLLQAAVAPLAALQEAGLRPLLTGGAALAVGHYPSPALRPLVGIGILVPSRSAQAALEVLGRLGWQTHPLAVLPPDYVGLASSCVLTEPAGGRVCLHWHATDEAWQNAQPVVREGCTTLIPDRLELALAQSENLATAPTLHLADVWLVLRTEPERTDWESLARRAQARHVIARMGLALESLHELLGEREVTSAALAALRRFAPVPAEAALCARWRRPVTRLSRLAAFWHEFRLGGKAVLHFPRYVAHRVGQPRFRALVRHRIRRWRGRE